MSKPFREFYQWHNQTSAFHHPVFENKRMLRARAIAAFDCCCQYCYEYGDPDQGPDGRAWHLDRIKPGALGGEYEEDNVTLACAACNSAKRDKYDEEERSQSLADAEFLMEYERRRDSEDMERAQRNYRLKDEFGSPANDNEVAQ